MIVQLIGLLVSSYTGLSGSPGPGLSQVGPAVHDPVCGKDGITYSISCDNLQEDSPFARGKGECPCTQGKHSRN